MIIARNGLDPDKEIQYLALGPDSGRLAALQQGLTDVVVITPPSDLVGRKLGYNILARAYEYVNYPLTGLATNVKKIQQNPAQVKRVIKSLVKATRLIREKREEAVKVLIAWGKIDPEQAYAAYDSTVKVLTNDGTIPADGLKLLIDLASKDAKITREVPVSEIADFTMLQEVQRELGLRN